MPPTSITHLVPAVFGREGVFGGAERYVLELARNMAKRVRTRLVSFGETAERWQEGDLEIHVVKNWIPYRRFRFDPFGPALLEATAGTDVIHVHQTHTMMASMALLAGHLRAQRIFATHLGGGGYGLHRLFDVDRYYDGHLHISQFSMRAFRHENRLDARVISGGVDITRFSPPTSDRVRSTVVYAGRLLPHKGINYLLEGVDDRTPVEVIGRTWKHAQKYSALLRELAIGKNVTFIENYDDAQMAEAFRGACCVVLPSVHDTIDGQHYSIPELLGQTLLEGMACGAPGLTTSICSLPEVVENGVTGFVVPPNDPQALGEAIRRFRADSSLVRRMGSNARERVLAYFTWDRVVDRCLSAYGEPFSGLSKNSS